MKNLITVKQGRDYVNDLTREMDTYLKANTHSKHIFMIEMTICGLLGIQEQLEDISRLM